MEKELIKLKEEFSQVIPTKFTNKDKIAIRAKINSFEQKQKARHFVPQVLTGLLSVAVILFGFYFSKDFIMDQTSGNNASAPDNQEEVSIQDSLENIWTKLDAYVTVEENTLSKSLSIFQTDTLGNEEKVGLFHVQSIEKTKDSKVVTLNGLTKITGDLYTDRNSFWFKPDWETLINFPIEQSDVSKKILLKLSNEFATNIQSNLSSYEELAQKWNSNEKIIKLENMTLVVNEIIYQIYEEQPSELLLKLESIDDKNNVRYEEIVHDTTIELSDKLAQIYEQYKRTLDDTLLIGLEPIEIFKLYIHAQKEYDREVEYGLLIKGEVYGTPDKETYLNDPFWQPTQVSIENGKKFYEGLLHVPYFTEWIISDTERTINFKLDDFTQSFQLHFDEENGVWKVPLLPMQ